MTLINSKSGGWSSRPVILAGQMKSGGSLCHSLLDGTPELFVFPETPNFGRLFLRRHKDPVGMRLDWLTAGSNVMQRYDGPAPVSPDTPADTIKLSGEIRYFDGWQKHFSMEEYHRGLKQRVAAADSVDDIMTAAAEAAEQAGIKPPDTPRPRAWCYRTETTWKPVDFTLGSGDAFTELQGVLDMFPQGKILMLVRDPRANVLSRQSHHRQRYGNDRWRGLGGVLRFFVDILAVSGSLAEQFRLYRRLGAERVFLVSYESLVTACAETMRDVCAFIGIDEYDNMTVPTMFGVPRRVQTAFDYNGAKVDAGRRDRWRTRLGKWRIAFVDAACLFILRRNKNEWACRSETGFVTALLLHMTVIRPVNLLFKLISVFGYAVRKGAGKN